MPEDVVRAKRFELVNDDGQELAVLSPSPYGGVALSFFEGDTDRLTLGVAPDGYATVAVQDEQGRERVKLSVGPSGPVINIKDENGTQRIQLQIESDGSSNLSFLDENLVSRLTVSQIGEKGGAPMLLFRDDERRDRIGLQLGPDKAALLSFVGEEETSRIVLGFDQEGACIFDYQDEEGGDRIF